MMKVLITGGSGDIAQAFSQVFEKKLFKVFAPGRDVLDVTDPNVVERYVGQVKPDVVVNCAGYISPCRVVDCDVGLWRRELMVNLFGCFLVSQAALRHGCQCIINIGSSAGTKGKSGWSGYCASKRGVVSLTESLCNEDVCCFCVSPGRTDTKMRSGLFPGEEKTLLLSPLVFAEVVFDLYRCRSRYLGCDIVVKKKSDGGVGLYRSSIVLEELDGI